jgi:hypothetical protein
LGANEQKNWPALITVNETGQCLLEADSQRYRSASNVSKVLEAAMIKVVLMRLDGTTSDEFRLAASESLVTLFDAHIVGLFLNVLPEPALAQANVSVEYWTRLLEQARQRGRNMEEDLGKRLRGITASAELRHFDVYAEEQGGNRPRMPDRRRVPRPAVERCRQDCGAS